MKTYDDIFRMMRYAIVSYECVPAVHKNYCCVYCNKNNYCGVDTIHIAMLMLYNY